MKTVSLAVASRDWRCAFVKTERVLYLILICGSIGCGGNPHPELRKVSGTVTFEDEPVAEATVAFYRDKSSRLATGRTDERGRFQLSSYDANDGAVPGEHTVVVTKVEIADEEASLSMDEAAASRPKRSRIRHLLPEEYASQETTPLQVVVPEDGTDNLEIKLSNP